MKFQRFVVLALFALSVNVWGADKAELIDSITKNSKLTKADSQKALDALISTTSMALHRGDSLSLVGLGTFALSAEGVFFSPDRPLVKAVAYDYLHTFWGSVILVQTKAYMKVEKLMNDLEKKKPGEIEYVAFPSMSFFAQELSDTKAMFLDAEWVTKGEAGEFAVVDQLNRASEIFAKGVPHEVAHIVQQRAQSIIKAAGLGLNELIKEQAQYFLDPKSPNLGLTDQQFKDVLKASELTEGELLHFFQVLGKEFGRLVQTGDRLDIEGFGSFDIPVMAIAEGNPQTGKEITLRAKKVVRFKAGAELTGTIKSALFKGMKDSVIQNIR